MVETIILSMCTFLIGTFVGVLISPPYKNTHFLSLPNGNEIHMWKGFVDPTLTYVAVNTDKNGNFIDGDGVVFDENGNIIIVDKNVKR